MSDQEPTTKPTLKTLLEIVREVRDTMNARLERIEIRLDRVESMGLETRADLRELKGILREHFPTVK